MAGAGVTVNVTPLLTCPPTVTATGPVTTPAGAVAAIDVSLQLVTAATAPLKVTRLEPWVAPKCAPAIVTA